MKKLSLAIVALLAAVSAFAFGPPKFAHAQGPFPGCTYVNDTVGVFSDTEGGVVGFYLDFYACSGHGGQFELFAQTNPNTDLIDNSTTGTLGIYVYAGGNFYGEINVDTPSTGHHGYEETWSPPMGGTESGCPASGTCTFTADTGPDTAYPGGVWMYGNGNEIKTTTELFRTNTN